MIKYYRDLQPGETLQAGDERLCVVSLTWSPIAETGVGWQVVDSAPLYRRPVDLPTLQRITPEAIKKLEEQHGYVTFFKRSRSVRCIYSPSQKCWWDDENVAVISPHAWDWFIDLSTIPDLQKRLVRELQQQLAELQSQPRLKPVTPEAMAELEQRCAVCVLVASEDGAQVLSYSRQGFWWRDNMFTGVLVNRPTSGYFIELAALNQEQQ